MIQTPNKYVKDIVKYTSSQPYHIYEILDYIVLPSWSSINTGITVDGTTVLEMTCNKTDRGYGGPHYFSSNDTNTDAGWGALGTWGLQFEDAATNLSVKLLGDYRDVKRTGCVYNDIANKKLRYNLTASGYLNIYNMDGTTLFYWDGSAYTDPTVVSSTPIKLFCRHGSHEYLTAGTRVYDTKIWKNSALVRSYIPVKRLSDNAIGFYDEVDRIFHSNEVSSYNFTGVSKSEPTYIDGTTTATYHINKIYNRGNIYWGN